MYECGKLKKVISNKSLFPVILEQCVRSTFFVIAIFQQFQSSLENFTTHISIMMDNTVDSGGLVATARASPYFRGLEKRTEREIHNLLLLAPQDLNC